jgi:hypothetical protein
VSHCLLVGFCFFSSDGFVVSVGGNGCPFDPVLYLRSFVPNLAEYIAK